MKDSLGPIAVVALLVAGAWFGVTQYMRRSSVAGASIPAAVDPGKDAKDKPAEKSGAKHRPPQHGAKRADAVEQALNASEPPPIVVNIPTANELRTAAKRPFPSAADLPPGTERLQIQDRFGRPDIQATTVNRGALIETYLYHRDDGRTTIVYLKDGRVQRTQAMP
jgi:hypothetical protein